MENLQIKNTITDGEKEAKAAADFLNMNEFSIRWILQGRGRSQKHKEKYKNWFYIK